MATTSRRALPYPVEADAADPAADIEALAESLDDVAFDDQGTLASRPSPGHAGNYYTVIGDPDPTKNGITWRDNGTAWIPVTVQGYNPGDLRVSAAVVSSDPVGWLVCDGRAVSRTTYAPLFDSIGTAHGAGNGTSTFNLPDYRGRALVGAGTGSGLTARSVGQHFGEETHQLTIAELASHRHTTDASITVSVTPGSGANVFGAGSDGTSFVGGDTPHNNVQPSGVATILVKT